MTRKKVFLIAQSAACALFVALLIAASVGIYREGVARRAEDPLAWIYTADVVARRARPALAVGLAGLALTVAGRLLGLREDEAPAAARVGKTPVRKPFKGLNAVRWAVLAVAVACVVAGVMNGTMDDVLAKAISVCSECIGLG